MAIIGIVPNIQNQTYKLNTLYVSSLGTVKDADEEDLEENIKTAKETREITPIIIPYGKHIEQFIDLVDGILLTGGGDISEEFLNEPLHEKAMSICPLRDKFEINVCTEAVKKNIPILAICRGMQILNVALGGTIHQHIENHMQTEERNIETHDVNLVEGSIIYKVYETVESVSVPLDENNEFIPDNKWDVSINFNSSNTHDKSISVNSVHHQAVNELGENLKISGFANDGTVEAIEHTVNNFCVGVQWHPEHLSDEILFGALKTAAMNYEESRML